MVRDIQAITALLNAMGAHVSAQAWNQQRISGARAAYEGNAGGSFAQSNLNRATQAALTTTVRVQRALDVLGDDAPEQLAAAGRLRLAHPQASLHELGQLSDPPMTKSVVAGRIKRLLALSDRTAPRQAIPITA